MCKSHMELELVSGHFAGGLTSQWNNRSYKISMSQVGTHPAMTLDVSRL